MYVASAVAYIKHLISIVTFVCNGRVTLTQARLSNFKSQSLKKASPNNLFHVR